MQVSLMQPYFFPYFEQFRHISQCDTWIVFDTVNYRRRSWMSRNRILNRQAGWTYINVPMPKGATQWPVADAVMSPGWQPRVREQLLVYRDCAPFYRETMAIVDEILDKDCRTLADLNTNGLRTVCRYLDIQTAIVRLSELKLTLPDPPPRAGAGGHFVTRALGADTYSNASGGKGLIREELFHRDGVELRFYEHRNIRYATGPFAFVPDLSIVDALMWMRLDTLQALIRE